MLRRGFDFDKVLEVCCMEDKVEFLLGFKQYIKKKKKKEIFLVNKNVENSVKNIRLFFSLVIFCLDFVYIQ